MQRTYNLVNNDVKNGKYFCITTLEPNNEISINEYEIYYGNKTQISFDFNIEYSVNGQAWTQYTNNTIITLTNVNDSVYFRGNNSTSYGLVKLIANFYHYDYMTFKSTKKCDVSGFVMSLLKLEPWANSNGYWYHLGEARGSSLANTHFESIFEELKIVNANKLKFYRQYDGNTHKLFAPSLFYNQQYLVNIPDISFYYGYFNFMFAGCTNLEKIPNFGALHGNYEGRGMFYNCTKLKISETQTGEYINSYTLPAGTKQSFLWIFKNTGGTYTGDGESQKTYYTPNEVI